MASQTSSPIPQPPPTLFLGNVPDIDPADSQASFRRLAEIYGEIFQLSLPGRKGRTIVLSSYDTITDCYDADRFEKPIDGPLKQVRALLGDGLFTAHQEEKAWGVAHRILMPVFGPMSIRKMFPNMMDIVSQMLLKWDRLGPSNDIVCTEDFTRLAFDVIAFCAFGFRFNNFYSERTHPFVTQMIDVLLEAGKRSSRTDIENKLRIFSAAKMDADIKKMHALCDEIIADRVEHPQPEAEDLLNPMLNGIDKETGEKMSHENVRMNMVTFLVAGHETTSGTLSFLFYHLLKNPDTYLKAQKEVDDVVGERALEVTDLPHLVYIKFAVYEALRFLGPIALNTKHATKPTKIIGKYDVEPDDLITLNLYGLHHDPKIWGNDAGIFRPERFLNGGWEKVPKNAWKAFGDGSRACIGRNFAEQEMIMTVALIMQKFQVELVDPSYDLHIKVTLTLKPEGLKLRVRRRPGRTMVGLGAVGSAAPTSSAPQNNQSVNGAKPEAAPVDLEPITVLYGSNAGTCKSYAEDMATNAPRHGFQATVNTLDSATENMPKDRPIIIIEPSYEGNPADNASKFISYLERNAESRIMDGVKYAVFGVGNSDWTQTYQRIPTLTDHLLEKMGGQRCVEFGTVDVKEDVVGPWEDWQSKAWKSLRTAYGQTEEVELSGLKAEITPPKFATTLGGSDIGYGIVKVNKDLGGSEVGLTKKHMEIELPIGASYRSGDYMVVLPLNNMATVKRVFKRFDLSADDDIAVSGTSKTFISSEAPTSVFDLLMTRVELGTPISQRQLKTLAEATPEKQRDELVRLATDEVFKKEVLAKRFSIIDILEDHPHSQLSFAQYLDMLKPLTPRQYSISSSPLANVEFLQTATGSGQRLTASITYDVHDEAAWSGGDRRFHGVASTYLARQEPGDKLRCFTRATNVNFHLPVDPSIPIIMVCAGTGLAPMRGFIQERATIKKARNATLGPAILYFGCRHHEKDFIYSEELKGWEADGAVTVRTCFSKVGPDGESTKYVPDRMWEDREELAQLFGEQKAKIFLCGSASKLAKSTADVCKKIWLERHQDKNEDDAQKWLDKVKEDRYVTDVFE